MENRLDQFRRYQYNVFLPGQHDWSSSLQQLASLGAALFVPSDLRTHSLWSWLLATRCPGCTIAFNRTGRCVMRKGPATSPFLTSSSLLLSYRVPRG